MQTDSENSNPGPTSEAPNILHIDMDAFFASIEIRDHPELRGRPVVVGGEGKRAVVAAASYPARTRGIRSAMPMAAARRLAPDLVIIPPRIDHYRSVSAEVMDVLANVFVRIEQISVDEAFVDAGPARRLHGPPEHVGAHIRTLIRTNVGLPCSVGGSVSRAVAKIASAQAKPDGLLIVPAEQTAEFLAPLPVGVISGIGPQAAVKLEQYGVRTVGDLTTVPRSSLIRAVGPRADEFARLAAGLDRTGVGTRVRDRSVGTERTWNEDLTDPEVIRRYLISMADEVARTLRRRGLVARTVVVKLRAPHGETWTRSATMDQPSATSERIREHALALWEKERSRIPRIRLAGVRATQLEPTTHGTQAELTGASTGWEGVDSAWDRVSAKFGDAAITRGSHVQPSDER